MPDPKVGRTNGLLAHRLNKQSTQAIPSTMGHGAKCPAQFIKEPARLHRVALIATRRQVIELRGPTPCHRDYVITRRIGLPIQGVGLVPLAVRMERYQLREVVADIPESGRANRLAAAVTARVAISG